MKIPNNLKLSAYAFALFSTILWQTADAQQSVQQPYPFEDQIRLETSPVKDQHKTGTCWCFATVSFLETELLRMGKPAFDLSEMFLVRHTYMQKAKDYVMYHGHNNFSQGGQAHDAITELNQHGIVPESVYAGINYDGQKHVHTGLIDILSHYLDSLVQIAEEPLSPDWKQEYQNILNGHFGAIPGQFILKEKSFNPRSFLEYLEINPDNYIELTSFTHHPWYRQFDLEVPDNWAHQNYYNLPIGELLKVMDHSINSGYSIVWDGDVSNTGFSHKRGLAVVPLADEELDKLPVEEKNINQQLRQQLFLNQTLTDDHLMHITGMAKDQDNHKFYITKNSWGTESNDFGGFLYMSAPYIRLNTIAIMVHKEAIPDEIRKKLDCL